MNRGRFDSRDPKLVFFAGVVGVPWQDLARTDAAGKPDLKLGYKPAVADATDPEGEKVDWDLILGAPFAPDATKRKLPTDPLMIETNQPNRLTGQKHPVTNEPLTATGWNSLNGGDRDTNKAQLQYACASPIAGGGAYGATPGTRFLEVLRRFGENAIVASICPSNLTDEGAPDFGYRQVMSSIGVLLQSGLTGRCLPRPVASNPDGSAPCLVIDARFPMGTPVVSPSALADCNSCTGWGRELLDPAVRSTLGGDVARFQCLCAVKQFEGTEREICQSQPDLPTLGTGGWCYVDPEAPQHDEVAARGAAEIVGKCPALTKRMLRFVDAGLQNVSLFITCVGRPTPK